MMERKKKLKITMEHANKYGEYKLKKVRKQ